MNKYKKQNIKLRAEIDVLRETIDQLEWYVADLRRDVKAYSIFFCELDHSLEKIKNKDGSIDEAFI